LRPEAEVTELTVERRLRLRRRPHHQDRAAEIAKPSQGSGAVAGSDRGLDRVDFAEQAIADAHAADSSASTSCRSASTVSGSRPRARAASSWKSDGSCANSRPKVLSHARPRSSSAGGRASPEEGGGALATPPFGVGSGGALRPSPVTPLRAPL